MANVKISNLTAATTPVAGTEVLPIVQSGATVKVSIANLTPGLSTITTAKGGTGLTSFTSGGVVYASSTSALATGSVLTFDGAILGVNGISVGRGAGAVASNTAVGASALAGNTSGAGNVAVGQNALLSNTTANYNNSFGAASLYSNTTGANNVAMGDASLYANTTGSSNTSIGATALRFNTTADRNTAVGYQAGYTNTTNIASTFVGYRAGYLSTGAQCTFVGDNAGQNSTGTLNGFFGQAAGYLVTSGAKNTIVGSYSGNQGGLDIRTASNYIVLSDGDGNPRATWASSGTFTSRNTNGRNFQWDGSEVYIDVDNTVTLGFPSFRWTVVYATTGTINTSDANTKQDIAALDDAEKRVAIAIKSLIKKYRFKDAVAKKGDAARIHVGVVAQEVQAAFVAEGLDPARYALFCSDTWYEVDGKPASEASTPFTQNTPNAIEVTRLGIRYDELLAFVIAAL
jgi:hypothetical protein